MTGKREPKSTPFPPPPLPSPSPHPPARWAEGTVNDNGVPVVRWSDRSASVLAFHDVAVPQSQLVMQLVYQRKSGLFCGGGIR